jgi:hypothetical protein
MTVRDDSRIGLLLAQHPFERVVDPPVDNAFETHAWTVAAV